MKNVLCSLAAALLLCGCVSPAGPAPGSWKFSSKTDPFNDVTTKTVSVNVSSGSYGWNKLSVFVSSRTNDLVVGVSSSLGLAVGTVELRIDQNPAWTISPQETPIYMIPSVPVSAHSRTNVQSEVMAGLTQIWSPFTATTGDRAARILGEMLRGKRLIYRTIGVNQASSTTGELKLDSSFANSVQKLGLDVSKF